MQIKKLFYIGSYFLRRLFVIYEILKENSLTYSSDIIGNKKNNDVIRM